MKLKYISLAALLSLSAFGECRDFSAWKSEYKKSLQEKGIATSVLQKTIDKAQFKSAIIKNDRAQAEFVHSFYGYLDRMHSTTRVNKAKEEYTALKGDLDALYEKYGISGQYLIAFWGMETNFGNFQGNIKAVDALSTLSCDARRSSFFANELNIFIDLVSKGQLPAGALSSWAGAMGHLQFLPNKIQKYRLDGDGDSKIDIFGSRKDAFETAGNYLKNEGWKKGEPWGQEVVLPKGFDYDLRGRNKPKSIAAWKQLGVKPVQNREFRLNDERHGAIIAPQGASGPAFIVYDNFNVIMIWNRSVSYALAIGLLADDVAENIQLVHKKDKNWQDVSKNQIIDTQKVLKQKGFYQGAIDGDWGALSRKALKSWQIKNNFPNDAYLSYKVYQKIIAKDK
ncbi:MAG: lytic murein transglycosylase [Alphaproteobacteria bacterium]